MSEILHPKVQRLFFNKANIARPRSICLLSVVSCCSKIMAEYCGYLFWEFWYNVNDTVPTANFTLKKRFTLLLLLLVLSNCPPLTAPDFQFPWTGWNVRERLLYLVALQAWKAKEDLKKIVKDLSRCFAWVGEKKLPSNTHTLMQTLHASTAYTAISCFMPVAQRSTITAPFRLPQSQ